MTFNEINNQADTSNPIFGFVNSGILYKEGEEAKKLCIRQYITNLWQVLE